MNERTYRTLAAAALAVAVVATACTEAAEPVRVDLPLRVDPSEVVTVENDLGYTVTLTSARMVLADMVFTIAGEAHTEVSALRIIHDLLVSTAHAHPGHYQGGDITGELLGRFVVDLMGDAELGTATLLEGTYSAANFTFARGTVDDGLDPSDALVGHTAILVGTAQRGDDEYDFTFVLDSPEDRVLVGAPFESSVAPDDLAPIRFLFSPEDELEGDTLFDGIDFAALDGDGDGTIRLADGEGGEDAEDAYNRLHRTFQTHDHYALHR